MNIKNNLISKICCRLQEILMRQDPTSVIEIWQELDECTPTEEDDLIAVIQDMLAIQESDSDTDRSKEEKEPLDKASTD